jgi:flavin-dependent dehydrogenase
MPNHYDVVLVGGGPGGSTTGSLLKKYRPDTSVLIIEREVFPREHIGESQLPQIGSILDEMGAWPAVEAADFPIKMGATYLWGRTPELWDFNFVDPATFAVEPRPAPYAGQRTLVALQVERAKYDDILLRHAAGLGCEVRQGTAVRKVEHDGDRITGLTLSDGTSVTGTYYADASGNAAVLRRALGVKVDVPTALMNIAVWDYWENAEWADTIGVGGTRIQIVSVGYGWVWFIPLGPTRTSIGLVIPVSYYKASGKAPAELYDAALAAAPRVQALIQNATREGAVRTTNDWSFVSERTTGENWFLVGESAGFADPILSAGLTLTQVGGRELAYTLIDLMADRHDPAWLRRHYHDNQVRRVRQHMKFAEFWYAANAQFTDLQEYCREIARGSGLALTAQQAWAWIAQGGFTNDVLGQVAIGGLDVTAIKAVTRLFTEDGGEVWTAADKNVFRLRLDGATLEDVPTYEDGVIRPVRCFIREGRRLPLVGVSELVVRALERSSDAQAILAAIVQTVRSQYAPPRDKAAIRAAMNVLEVLVSEGWVEAALDPSRPRLHLASAANSRIILPHEEFHHRAP